MYDYIAEKFGLAGRCLMAPHSQGETSSYVDAFHQCALALAEIHLDDLDPQIRPLVHINRRALDTRGIEDPPEVSPWFVKAERLTRDERREFSDAVDELAYWFSSHRPGDW